VLDLDYFSSLSSFAEHNLCVCFCQAEVSHGAS